MPLEIDLKQFGFDEKKARIYLAVLELGEAKAAEVAKKSGIERPTCYDILNKLVQDGLISFFDKRGVKHFVAEDPEKIQVRLAEKERALNQLLPELKSVYNSLKTKPKIKFFEGLAGIKTILEDTLTPHDKQLLGILSMRDLYEIPGKEFMDNYVKRRIEAKVKLRVIRSRIKEVGETWPTNPKEYRELRYAPEKLSFPVTIYIYDNKVGIIGTKKENFGMLIESEEFFETFKNLFEVLWLVSKAGPTKD